VSAGIPADKITLLGTRWPNPEELCTHDAQARWQRFRFIAVKDRSSDRFANHQYVGGGEWRSLFIPDTKQWPASWIQMERSKFLSPDQQWLFKFEGMGRIGEEVRARAQYLAHAGIGCELEDGGGGYSAYRVVRGRPAHALSISPEILEHLARYCAVRESEFKTTVAHQDPVADMVSFNLQQEFGLERDCIRCDLPIEAHVVTDGRMQPYEWIVSPSGQILKTDAASHGDDHFFPGPLDIAWDLAGVIVEWELQQGARSYLLETFRKITGRKLQSQMDAYCLAYSSFRMSVCKMAVPTVGDPLERARLQAAYARYRASVQRLLPQSSRGEGAALAAHQESAA
jgi:hypothetical protein